MNRRTALKLIASAFVAPLVHLRSEIDRERLMLAFCDGDFCRYNIGSPFSVGSLTYATDARKMVRAELPSRVESGERRIPDVESCWESFWHPGEFVPLELPAVDAPSLVIPPAGSGVCPLCDDRRLSFGDRWPSEEEIEAVRDWDVDDNTYRDPNCPLCRGRDFKGPSALRVGGILMNYSQLKPIAALPNVRISANRKYEGDHFGPLLFRADGFEGMAMGLAKDD